MLLVFQPWGYMLGRGGVWGVGGVRADLLPLEN